MLQIEFRDCATPCAGFETALFDKFFEVLKIFLHRMRLELLTEVVPRLSRVMVLWTPSDRTATINFKEYCAAAKALKLQLQSLEVRLDNPDLETAFQTAVKSHVNALITITTAAPLFLKQKQIVDLAVKNRLPTMFSRQHMLRQMATADNAASFAADTAGKKRSLQYRQPPALNPFRGIIPEP